MTALLEAVDALTKETHDHIAQKDDDGKWLKAHTVTMPPLLVRMHESVMPSSGTDGGSKSAKSTRSPVDLDALFEFAKMTSQIGDWCRIAGTPVTRDPVTDLRRWYTDRLTQTPDEHDDRFYLGQLRAWANIIRNHLYPPERFTPEIPCPVCGAKEWGDMINGGGTWPIEVRYRKDDDGTMSDETALCRPCRTVWQGHDAIVELAEEAAEKTA